MIYHRLTDDEIKSFKKKYEKFILYQITRKGINNIALNYDDLQAEEIWKEAFQIVEELKTSPNRLNDIDTLKEELISLFRHFQEETIYKERTIEQAERSAFLVLFAVISLLIIAKKDIAENPYNDLIERIAINIKDHPLCKKLFFEIRNKEIEFENQGLLVDFVDVMQTTEDIQSEDKLLQEAINISLSCEKFVDKKYSDDYIKQIWMTLWNNKEELNLTKLLSSQSKIKIICGVIGIMQAANVFKTEDGKRITNKQLAHCLANTNCSEIDEESFSRYISSAAKETKEDKKPKSDVNRLLDKVRKIV